MNLADLQKEAHAIAQDQGWYDAEPTFGDSVASIHGALNEVLEEYRSCGMAHNGSSYEGEPFGIAAELADVVIQLAGTAERYRYSLDPDENIEDIEDWERLRWCFEGNLSFGDWMARLHWFAAEAFGSDVSNSNELVEEGLAYLVVGVQRMAANYGIDLDAAIEAKMEYYRASPHRHVGGRAVTSQRSELITVSDGHTPCGECPGYIDTKSEAFIALVIPMEAHHQWRGAATFHPKCYLERDPTRSVNIVTGVHEGEAL